LKSEVIDVLDTQPLNLRDWLKVVWAKLDELSSDMETLAEENQILRERVAKLEAKIEEQTDTRPLDG
jgi:regulator of replication initiation timing